MDNIKIWFLTWVSGLTKVIDGVIILATFGIADPGFTAEIVREISNVYFNIRYRF